MLTRLMRFWRAVWYMYHYGEQIFCDHLTGLYNLRFFHEEAQKILAQAKRYNWTLTLALLDLDGLKRINDTGGHKAGDRALVVFATALKENSREADLLCRAGGDEFLVLLPETTETDAKSLIVRLQEILLANGISFSFGVVTWNGDDSLESLIEKADRRMYEEKKACKVTVVER